MSLNLKHVFYRQYVHSANIYLLTEVFNTLTFNEITDEAKFKFTLLLLVFLMSWLFPSVS